MKTLVIGLDGATWSVIDPLMAEGKLPNLQSIAEGGTRGTLESTMPPMTPLAWTSISTGVNPGKHGIYDFLEQDHETYRVRPTDYDRMDVPAIWDVFNLRDEDVGVINYPLVRPPDKVDSFFISGIPASTNETIAYPESLQSDLQSAGYQVTPEVQPDAGSEAYFEAIVELMETQASVAVELLDRYDPALLWTVFMGTDWAQHYLWDETVDGRNAVDEFYVQMDRILGQLLDRIDDGTRVFVMSDHGSKRIQGEIHMNSLLRDWGYLAIKDSTEDVLSRIKTVLTGQIWKAGRSLPAPVKDLIKKQMSERRLTDVRAMAGVSQLDIHDRIHWSETAAFSYGYMGRVFVNREDWYPEGTVHPDEYEDIVGELIERLESLTHPDTGEPLVDRAVPGIEVYPDGERREAPDVLFAPHDWEFMVYGDFADEKYSDGWIHEPRKRIADHDPEGILIADGPGIEEASVNASAVDIAPTLLYSHGLPVVEGMDGQVLKDVFSPQFRSNYDISTISPEEIDADLGENEVIDDSEVRNQLEDLGYL